MDKFNTIRRKGEDRFSHLDRIEKSHMGVSAVLWVVAMLLIFILGLIFYLK